MGNNFQRKYVMALSLTLVALVVGISLSLLNALRAVA
jgi:hypothetical protein